MRAKAIMRAVFVQETMGIERNGKVRFMSVGGLANKRECSYLAKGGK